MGSSELQVMSFGNILDLFKIRIICVITQTNYIIKIPIMFLNWIFLDHIITTHILAESLKQYKYCLCVV